jgi:hypothetical protein
VQSVFEHLNGSDALLPPTGVEEAPGETAYRRVLGRLGQYTEAVVAPLNMRPRAAALLSACPERVEVRVSTPASAIVVVIAPDGDLSAEVFFLRTMAARNLPARRLIAHDLSRTAHPFSYAVESHVGGGPLDQVESDALLRVAARQVGRTLRRLHQAPAPGFGWPTPTGRWPAATWRAALRGWLERIGAFAQADALLEPATAARLWAALLDHPALDWAEPRALHGAVTPAHAIVTRAESIQLEALTCPGPLAAGDPLFDLALGLAPAHPAAFRAGLLEGYTAMGALDAAQEARLAHLRRLVQAVAALAAADEAALAEVMEAGE